MLRWLPYLNSVSAVSDKVIMAMLRMSLELQISDDDILERIFAPYAPSNKPETYWLRYKGKPFIELSVSTGGAPFPAMGINWHIDFDSEGVSTDESVFYSKDDFDLFVHELHTIGKGVTLSTKTVGDTRALSLLASPLWPLEILKPKNAALNGDFLERLKTTKGGAFWARYFKALLNGKFDEFHLAREIVQISDVEWERGYEHIGEVIAGIEADLLNQRSTIAETISFKDAPTSSPRPDDFTDIGGLFDVQPVEVTAPEALERAVSKVEDSFADAITLGHGQHVRETSLEGLILTRIFKKYRDDPHRVEMDFEDVRQVLFANMSSEANPNRNYPRCDELDLLLNALVSACGEIRAAYPDVAKARVEMDETVRANPISADDKEIWISATPILRAISSDQLDQGWVEDIGELVNDAVTDVPKSAPRLPAAGERIVVPRKSVVRRLAFRISSIRIKLGTLIKKADDSAAAKLGGLITVIGVLIQLLMQMLEKRLVPRPNRGEEAKRPPHGGGTGAAKTAFWQCGCPAK